jgi:hypothetical protein
LGFWVLSHSSASADGGALVCSDGHGQCILSRERWGYGGNDRYAVFYGFGLSYHLGYGYGGKALGVGPFGGYPAYGGPGYPHKWPRLQRICGIAPFNFYGGPYYPPDRYSNYFEHPGPLVVEQPVVGEGGVRDVETGAGFVRSGAYGPFTGALPYPESFFAGFTIAAGAP